MNEQVQKIKRIVFAHDPSFVFSELTNSQLLEILVNSATSESSAENCLDKDADLHTNSSVRDISELTAYDLRHPSDVLAKSLKQSKYKPFRKACLSQSSHPLYPRIQVKVRKCIFLMLFTCINDWKSSFSDVTIRFFQKLTVLNNEVLKIYNNNVDRNKQPEVKFLVETMSWKKFSRKNDKKE